MNTIIVNHKVRDFADWLPVFDAHHEVMKQHGFTNVRVLRSTEDANDVTVIGNYSNPELLKKFFDSEDIKAAMLKSGVIGVPSITTHQTEKSLTF